MAKASQLVPGECPFVGGAEDSHERAPSVSFTLFIELPDVFTCLPYDLEVRRPLVQLAVVAVLVQRSNLFPGPGTQMLEIRRVGLNEAWHTVCLDAERPPRVADDLKQLAHFALAADIREDGGADGVRAELFAKWLVVFECLIWNEYVPRFLSRYFDFSVVPRPFRLGLTAWRVLLVQILEEVVLVRWKLRYFGGFVCLFYFGHLCTCLYKLINYNTIERTETRYLFRIPAMIFQLCNYFNFIILI